MCLNPHEEKHDVVSLGMIVVTGRMPTVEALKLINGRLQYFGCGKCHVIGAVTNMASMMKKIVKNMDIDQLAANL